MHFSRPLLLALILLGLMSPVASAADAPDILFSASPKNVQIVKSGKALRLVMPAATRTTWFTDRPERKAGTTNLRRLATTWSATGFRADPPNAALILTHKGQTRTHVITLTRPRITKGRVSFRIRVVPNQDEAGHRHTDPLRRGRYARAQLFIDDTALPPCGATLLYGITCLLASGAQTTFGANLLSTATVAACVEGTTDVLGLRPVLFYQSMLSFGYSGQWNPPTCGDRGPVELQSGLVGPLGLESADVFSNAMQVLVTRDDVE